MKGPSEAGSGAQSNIDQDSIEMDKKEGNDYHMVGGNVVGGHGFIVNAGSSEESHRRHEWRFYTYLMNLMWSNSGPELGPMPPWRAYFKIKSEQTFKPVWVETVTAIQHWLS